MKICLINTYAQGGGAAIACIRLGKALQDAGHQVTLLSATGQTKEIPSQALDDDGIGRLTYKARFMAERLSLVPVIKSRELLFQFSVANTGKDISKHPAVQAADIIHLHWINQGMLSLKDIQSLIATGKPVVWTLHDMWAFTGGCHYNGTCTHYLQACGNCPYFRNPSPNDLSHQVWNRKNGIFNNGRIRYITCSNWLAGEAQQSGLLKNEDISAIPNPIDLNLFTPKPMQEARQRLGLKQDQRYILFGSANVSDKRKGFNYFIEALQKFRQQHPDKVNNTSVLLVGKDTGNIRDLLPLDAVFMGKVDIYGMVDIYNASNLFVIPSLQDNLPNTIVESMACGTPVVGFANGGIPEMITHQQNGYLVPSENTDELAAGISYVLDNRDMLSAPAREFTVAKYHPEQVARQYIQVYRDLLQA